MIYALIRQVFIIGGSIVHHTSDPPLKIQGAKNFLLIHSWRFQQNTTPSPHQTATPFSSIQQAIQSLNFTTTEISASSLAVRYERHYAVTDRT